MPDTWDLCWESKTSLIFSTIYPASVLWLEPWRGSVMIILMVLICRNLAGGMLWLTDVRSSPREPDPSADSVRPAGWPDP